MNATQAITDPDTEAILQSLVTGKPLDAKVRDRIRADGDRVREDLRKRLGSTNIAAELIRASRDE